MERLIRRVPVKPGDVYYMPSGMVHAIGGGILLYEIQQSSDVTYRLWDFDRVNAAGEKRPLHIRQSLDVIVPELIGQIAPMPENDGCGLVTLLAGPAFHLECANVNGECELAPQPHAFRMLTALAGLLLSWQGDAIELKAGDSVLLPASCPPVTLMGVAVELTELPGVTGAESGMGTSQNVDLLTGLDYPVPAGVTKNDLMIALDAEGPEALEAAFAAAGLRRRA